MLSRLRSSPWQYVRMRPAVAIGVNDETSMDKIGSRLRAARHRQGLSIAQLAEATNLTRGFLSQVERDLASTSLGTLVRICNALDLRVGELLDSSRTELVRAAQRPRIAYARGQVEEFLLTSGSDGRLEVYDSIFKPGAEGDGDYSLQADLSFVYVLDGSLDFQVEHKTFRLEAGDSLTYSPTKRHTWRNPSSRRATRALWAVVRQR